MLKNLQKCLMASSIFAISVSAQAQDAIEKFDVAGGWMLLENYPNYTGPNPPTSTECYTGATPGGPAITKDKNYAGTAITYTLFNGGVNPFCGVKGPAPTTVNPPPSLPIKGFVELGKWWENATGNPNKLSGSLTTTAFPYIESINVIISATGATRRVLLSTSTDGVTWTPVPSTQDNLFGADSMVASVYGDSVVGFPIQQQNVMLKFGAGKDRIRIHKIEYFFTPLSIEKSTTLANGATITVIDNNVNVKSPSAGTVQIVSSAGVVVAQNEVASGAESSFSVPAGGLYIVRLSTNNKMFAKKVIVQ